MYSLMNINVNQVCDMVREYCWERQQDHAILHVKGKFSSEPAEWPGFFLQGLASAAAPLLREIARRNALISSLLESAENSHTPSPKPASPTAPFSNSGNGIVPDTGIHLPVTLPTTRCISPNEANWKRTPQTEAQKTPAFKIKGRVLSPLLMPLNSPSTPSIYATPMLQSPKGQELTLTPPVTPTDGTPKHKAFQYGDMTFIKDIIRETPQRTGSSPLRNASPFTETTAQAQPPCDKSL